MIYEDERAAAAERLDFVLHLGDFIYEVVVVSGGSPARHVRPPDARHRALSARREDRRLPHPDDARRLSRRLSRVSARPGSAGRPRPLAVRAHVGQPRVFLARLAGLQCSTARHRPRRRARSQRTRRGSSISPRACADRAARRSSGSSAPTVRDAPVEKFDEHGLGQEPNNLAAIESLTGYRALRFGRNVDLIITDQHSYRSEEPTSRPEAAALSKPGFPGAVSAGGDGDSRCGSRRTTGAIRRRGSASAKRDPNFRKDQPRRRFSAANRSSGFSRVCATRAPRGRVWGNPPARSTGASIRRTCRRVWRRSRGTDAGYAGFGGGDTAPRTSSARRSTTSCAISEITGFVTVAGDRHSFWAGLAAKSLPPQTVRSRRRCVHHRGTLFDEYRRYPRRRTAERSPASAARCRGPHESTRAQRQSALSPRRSICFGVFTQR